MKRQQQCSMNLFFLFFYCIRMSITVPVLWIESANMAIISMIIIVALEIQDEIEPKEWWKKEEKDENAINRDAIELLCLCFCLCALWCVCALRAHSSSECILITSIPQWFSYLYFLLLVPLFWMLWVYFLFVFTSTFACLIVCRHQYFKFNKLFKFSISIASVGWILENETNTWNAHLVWVCCHKKKEHINRTHHKELTTGKFSFTFRNGVKENHHNYYL